MIAPRAADAQGCRQALVLALDVSGSVNAEEYQQQLDGLAVALDSAEVRSLILFGSGPPVSLAVFEWSSRNHQSLIQPWITLDSGAALDSAIARISSYEKQRAGLKTALGTALNAAAGLLAERPDCWQHTIDVSGDGPNNIGVAPRDIYSSAAFDRVTVNALVIGSEDPAEAAEKQALLAYFQAEVIYGPAAFALIANGHADYARAMQQKLERELSVPIFGSLPDAPTVPPA